MAVVQKSVVSRYSKANDVPTSLQPGLDGRLRLIRIEQLVEALLQATAGGDDLGRKLALAIACQSVALDELAREADGGQLGPRAMLDVRSLVCHSPPFSGLRCASPAASRMPASPAGRAEIGALRHDRVTAKSLLICRRVGGDLPMIQSAQTVHEGVTRPLGY